MGSTENSTWRREVRFAVGEQLLVPNGEGFNKTSKWPTFKSFFYGPCTVIEESHPRYLLLSQIGRYSRERIHVRRMRLYRERLLYPNYASCARLFGLYTVITLSAPFFLVFGSLILGTTPLAIAYPYLINTIERTCPLPCSPLSEPATCGSFGFHTTAGDQRIRAHTSFVHFTKSHGWSLTSRER